MNTLLKITLNSTSRYGEKEIAHTSVICKMTESNLILSRFFDCFNMEEASPFGDLLSIDADIAPVWDFDDSDKLQVASDLDENNPFMLDEPTNNWVWSTVNERLYDTYKSRDYSAVLCW